MPSWQMGSFYISLNIGAISPIYSYVPLKSFNLFTSLSMFYITFACSYPLL